MSDATPKSNDILRKVFRQLHGRIVNDVDTSSLIDSLYAAEVIDTRYIDDLKSIFPQSERSRQLLFMLGRSHHATAFIHLRTSLEAQYGWLVEEIDQQYNKFITEPRLCRETSRSLANEVTATDSAMTPPDAPEHLQAILKCSLCKLVNDNPIILPCCHKLCGKCLDDCMQNKQKPDVLVCSVCGMELKLPNGNLAGLPKNHFIERWKVTKQLLESLGGQKPCYLCETETEQDEIRPAQVYCISCRKNFCGRCSKSHDKLMEGHKSISLDNDGECYELAADMTAPHCEKHMTQCLSRYCFDCNSVTCESCFSEQHQQHDCVDVHEAVNRKRKELDRKQNELHDCMTKCQLLPNDMSLHEEEIERQISDTATAIETQAEELKKEIDRQKIDRLNSLDAIRTNRIMETRQVTDQIQKHESRVEAFIGYVEQLKDGGKDVEIACQMNGLQDRATELQKLMDDIERNIAELIENKVNFTAATITHDNLIGELNAQHSVESNARVIQMFVDAVTSLNDEIYVLHRPSRQLLDVYDANTKVFKGKLLVNDLSDNTDFSCGLTSCTGNNCLYVCDSLRRFIHRLDIGKDFRKESEVKQKTWQVSGKDDDAVTSLSVNSARQVLVTCSRTHRILSYTKDGKLLDEIKLDEAEVTRPQHAIQLNDRFIVSHSGPVYGVSIVNKKGHVEVTYRNDSVQINDNRLKSPRLLAVADNGCILVADNGHNRIVALNPTLNVARTVTLPGVSCLVGPWSLHLDNEHDRLLIGEERGGRVHAFKGASSFLPRLPPGTDEQSS